ncbi:MAG: YeeE/YedE family protein [Nitrospirota bacterium]
MDSTLAFVVSGLLVGGALGFVLQRGRFCVNSAYREVLFKDYTMLRAYVIAVVVTIIGANLFEDMGWLRQADETGAMVAGTLYRQSFVPWANIIGGYIFGMGIVLAGGCGSGILYRVGEGNLAYVVAVFGFFFGIAMTNFGILKPVFETLTSYQVFVGEEEVPTLYNIIGVNKWIIIAVITAAAIPFVFKDNPFQKAKKGYSWSLVGLLVGIVAVAAFWASSYFGGNARGLSFTGPLRELFLAVTMGDSKARPALIQSKSLLGANFSWSSLYVLAVPFGAYLSGKLLNEVKLKVPPADELFKVLLGGIIMGIGAQIAGGCNIGQGLTGVSTLAVSSWVANSFTILGNWTMVYFLLIRPMKD